MEWSIPTQKLSRLAKFFHFRPKIQKALKNPVVLIPAVALFSAEILCALDCVKNVTDGGQIDRWRMELKLYLV